MVAQSAFEEYPPYFALKEDTEYWVVSGSGALAFRFGPFTGPEVGKIITRALDEKIGITIIAQCGKEIDWELLRDVSPRAKAPEASAP